MIGAAFGAVSVLMAGASGTLHIPVPPAAVVQSSSPKTASFEVVNRAIFRPAPIGHVSAGTALTAQMKRWEPKFGELLARDLQALFAANTKSGPGDVRVRATILEAEITFTTGLGDNAPLVGIFTTLNDKAMLAKARIQFEVERNGRVENTFVFEHQVDGSGGRATDEVAADAIARMMVAFRAEALPRIKAEFIDRYL
jgi:hypothetical protein